MDSRRDGEESRVGQKRVALRKEVLLKAHGCAGRLGRGAEKAQRVSLSGL